MEKWLDVTLKYSPTSIDTWVSLYVYVQEATITKGRYK